MSAPILHAPPALWLAARALLSTIFALFGEPARIATQHTHTKPQRTLLLKWLHAGEALLRHLLLIEAAHVAKPNTRPLLHKRRKRVRCLVSFEADKPEDWRVSLRSFTKADRRLPAGKPAFQQSPACENRNSECRLEAGGPLRPQFTSAWPLAERAEALLRAFNNPEPYARRLAQRLHATPHRSAELVRAQSTFEHVIDADDFTTLREHTGMARRRLESG